MLELAGYADRLSVRPGETIAFKVSSKRSAPYNARLVRIICADPNPKGPGIHEEDVAASLAGSYPSRLQPVRLGSHGEVELGSGRLKNAATLVATIWPTTPYKGRQAIVSTLDEATGAGLALEIDETGRASAIAGRAGGTTQRISLDERLRARRWYQLAATVDGDGVLSLSILHLPSGRSNGLRAGVEGTARLDSAGPLRIAASGGQEARHHFNGKIEAPAVFDRALGDHEVDDLAAGRTPSGLVAAWDFARETMTPRIVDTGPHKLDGALVNLPTRAMAGSRWTGREMCWRHAPAEYAAIHFHDDDLYDCGWATDFTWTVPAGTRSGCYAVRLSCGDAEENIPFYVLPAKGKPTANVLVLVSTFTYTVYHNHTRPEWNTNPAWKSLWLSQARDWGAYRHNPGDHREYGLSTYNYHTDGSGIAYASWLRPMLTVRSGYITYPDESIRASGLRHMPADTHLTAWLEAKGIAYDIITDLELDEEGYDLLKPYRVVMTGSHPEYHTPAMIDALTAYRDGGGRLMYMGGNGFYWKVARSKHLPAAIEIRRAEGGIRAWAAEVGEYYNAFDGEYGGMWRRNGRPPQNLVGVGFTAQGNFIGSHYRVKPEARKDARVSWMLEGVPGETIGGFGLSGHGAAGFELDRADKRLGTPEHAVIIASSEGHKPEAPWVLVPEEQLTHLVTWSGEPAPALIRADMTFFETPNNGAVFSTGSITFCGSLPAGNFDNAVSRLTENVLRRFLDPKARFDIPEDLDA